eukprot:scaffold73812_cov27-Tisochrysis_lutea.AAC.3
MIGERVARNSASSAPWGRSVLRTHLAKEVADLSWLPANGLRQDHCQELLVFGAQSATDGRCMRTRRARCVEVVFGKHKRISARRAQKGGGHRAPCPPAVVIACAPSSFSPPPHPTPPREPSHKPSAAKPAGVPVARPATVRTRPA